MTDCCGVEAAHCQSGHHHVLVSLAQDCDRALEMATRPRAVDAA